MPQLIQYGDTGAVIEFPDGLDKDQIAAILRDRKDELTERFSKGRLASAGSSFGKSFVEGVGQTVSGAGRTQAYRIPNILRSIGMQAAMADEEDVSRKFLEQAAKSSQPLEREKLVQQEPLYQTGRTISAAAGDVFQPNPKYAGEFFTDVLPSGAGSTIPIIPTAAVAGPIPAVIQYGVQVGEAAAQEAEAAGRPDAAGTAFLANAGVGALSELALGVPANIMRYVKAARGAGVAPEVAGRAIKQELGSKISQWLAKNPVKAVVGEGAAREFTQEGLEQAGQNLIASKLAGYDPERPLTKDVLTAAAAGGILGGLFTGGAHAVGAAEPALRRRALTSSVERALAESKAQEETAKRAAEDIAIERAIRRRALIPTEERRGYARKIGSSETLPLQSAPKAGEEVAEEVRPAAELAGTPAPQATPPKVDVVAPPQPEIGDLVELHGYVGTLETEGARRVINTNHGLVDVGETDVPIVRLAVRNDGTIIRNGESFEASVGAGKPWTNAYDPDTGELRIRSKTGVNRFVLDGDIAKYVASRLNAVQPQKPPTAIKPRAELVSPETAEQGLATIPSTPFDTPVDTLILSRQLEREAAQKVPPPALPSPPKPASVPVGETITSPDVRKGTEMLAEAGAGAATPAPPLPATTTPTRSVAELTTLLAKANAALKTEPASSPTRQRLIDRRDLLEEELSQVRLQKATKTPAAKAVRRRPAANRPWDVIDEFENSIGGKISLQAAQQLIEDYKPIGAARRLFTRTKGVGPDDAAQAVSGFKRFPSEVEFLEALNAAAQARKGARSQAATEKTLLKQQEAQRLDFEANAFKANAPGKPTGEPIAVNDLYIGDTFKLAGVNVKVSDMIFDPETTDLAYVELEDGRRFDVQTVSGDQVIYPDKGTLVQKLPSTEFLPPEDLPQTTAAVPTPKLRPMEKGTADLFQGQDQPFNLAGETGTDFERIAAEKARREQTAREAAALAAQQQRTIPGVESISTQQPPAPIAEPILTTAIAQWRSEHPTAPQVTVVNDPTLVRTDAQGNDRGVRGLWRGGQFVLNRAFIGSAEEARNVLEHEHTHSLLSSPEGAQAVREAVAANLGQQERVELQQRYVRRTGETDPAYESRVMEEWLSSLAEQNPSLWQRIIARLRQWLSKVGIINLSDEEIGREIVRALRVSRLTPEAAGSERESLTAYRLRSSAQKQALVERAEKAGVPAEGIAEVERMASVQAGLVPPPFVSELADLRVAPERSVEGRTSKLLQFLTDFANISIAPRSLASMPRTTPQEIKESELAAGELLSQHLFTTGQSRFYTARLERANEQLRRAMLDFSEAQRSDLEASFSIAMVNALTERYDAYIENKRRLAVGEGNLTLALERLLTLAVQRTGELKFSIRSVGAAFEAIARNMPEDLLKPSTAPEDILQWTRENLSLLRTQAGEAALGFITQEKALPEDQNVLAPPLLEYDNLAKDLAKMRQLQQRRDTARKQVEEFKSWFAGERKPSEVGALRFARDYYKLRQQKELAADIAARLNKSIEVADRHVRALVNAIDFIERMTKDPDYLQSVKLTSDYSNALVQKLAATNPTTKDVEYIGPLGGKYRINLRPDKVQSDELQENLINLISEIEAFSAPDAKSDPVLVRTWREQLPYLEALATAYGTPSRGAFVQGLKIGNRQLVADIMDWFNRFILLRRGTSPQNFLNRMGTKAAQNAALTFQATDAYTEVIALVNENKDYGMQNGGQLFLDGMQSHGWYTDSAEMRTKYEALIIEPIIASRQNNVSLQYKVGELIDGIWPITPQDMAVAMADKRWKDAINQKANPEGKTGNPALRWNPVQPLREESGVSYSTKQIGTGPNTSARISSTWGENFTAQWLAARTDAAKLKLLHDDINFTMAIGRRVNERNILEYTRKSPLLEKYYNEARRRIMARLLYFDAFEDFVDWVAVQKQADEFGTTLAKQRNEVIAAVLSDVNADVVAFNDDYLNASRDPKELSTVPEPLRKFLGGRNSFTSPRIGLVAPSSYYSYSTASEPRKIQYASSARLVFELRQLNALDDLRQVLRQKLTDMKGTLQSRPTRESRRKARIARNTGESLVDYQELTEQVAKLDVLYKELSRVTLQDHSVEEHVAFGFANAIGGLQASMLLARPQPAITNLFGGIIAMPAIMRAKQGRALAAFATPITANARLVKLAMTKMASVVKNNPRLKSVWERDIKQWGAIARTIANAAEYYNAVYAKAVASGGVGPYDLKGRWNMLWRLRQTGGRLELSEPAKAIQIMNQLAGIPGIAQLVATVKAVSPRLTDYLANLVNTQDALGQLRQLQEYAYKAFKTREELNPKTFRDLTKAQNFLTPAELGAPTHKNAEEVRQLFNASGAVLDKLMLNYYDRVKGMTEEERANTQLMDDEGARTAYVMEYLKMTNLATQSNRAPVFRGSIPRRLLFMFFGYPTAMAEHLSQLTRSHSADKGFKANSVYVGMIFTALAMLILTGMMAREPGQELTELWSGRTSGQLRLGNLLQEQPEVSDIARYMMVSSANIIPYFGEVANRSLGGIANKPFLDVTSMVPIANFVNDTGNALIKIATSRDPVYPITDWARRWFPPLEPVLNRLPAFAGDVEQRNAMAVLRAAAPSDMELRQGFGTAAPRQTTVSPIVRDLISASYLGDTDKVRELYAQAVEEKRRLGVANPEQAVWSTVQSRIPARSVFGKLPTASEEARILSRMTDSQRAIYNKSKTAFGLIADVAGKDIRFTDASAIKTTGTASLRSRSPFSRLRRGRRSLLGRTRTRFGSSRKRRRRIGFGNSRRSLVA